MMRMAACSKPPGDGLAERDFTFNTALQGASTFQEKAA